MHPHRSGYNVPQFLFDYFDGKHVHTALDAIELPDLDTAYLEAFKAATDMWGEALRQRRNPSSDCFLISDRNGGVVMEVPFAEITESTRGAPLQPPSNARSGPLFPGVMGLASRHISKAEGLSRTNGSALSGSELLDVFGQSLALLENTLRTIPASQHAAAEPYLQPHE
jgi:hypothetical protein